MMEKEPNRIKQSIYAQRKVQLKKALSSGFYFEAIFLEYAIIEDRTESVLGHAGGIKLVNRQNRPLTLAEKLNKIRSCQPFQDKYVRKRLSLELLEQITEWKDKRNQLVHALMKNPSETADLQNVAEEGNELVKTLDSKVKSVNAYFDKRHSAETA